jgi:hypothetical protein
MSVRLVLLLRLRCFVPVTCNFSVPVCTILLGQGSENALTSA